MLRSRSPIFPLIGPGKAAEIADAQSVGLFVAFPEEPASGHGLAGPMILIKIFVISNGALE
jgi:hypothetical protein